MKYINILTKRIMILFLLVFTNNVVNAQTVNPNPKKADYDIVVIGGTPSGIAAAIAAGRSGKSVIIIEQGPVLGGTLSSGVARLDDYVVEANSGIMEEFRTLVMNYNINELKNDDIIQKDLKGPDHAWNPVFGRSWEPKIAAKFFTQLVAKVPSIKTKFNEVPVDVVVKNDRITAVITQDRSNDAVLGAKHTYTGRIIIDATYEGDVAALAKVPFRIGREARSIEEPHAGKIYTDAFCVQRQKNALFGTIFPGSTGEADDRTQAFTFRFVAKDYGRPDHPFRITSPPLGYDPSLYAWNPNEKPWLPNKKADLLGIESGDLTGLSTKYVLSNWQERAKLEKVYKNHELGWLYYIQTIGKSPQWGLPDDEFTDNGNWPYRLYVRQGRRIEGMYTITESDLHKDLKGNGFRGPLHQDGIAIGVYPMDVHFVQISKDEPCGEGAIHLNDVTGPYQIPYGVMIPKKINGLIVPVAISSTHVAMSSIRMEPVWSSLGQAAGIAAALALNDACEMRDVSVSKIQRELLRQKSLLFFYKDISKNNEEFEAVQRLSVKNAIDGDENYYFRPNQPITMGEFAQLAINGLDIPLSITSEHFKDVPRGNPYFKYIETLYDYSTKSTTPFFTFEVRNKMNYWWNNPTMQGPPVYAFPDQEVSSKLAIQIVSGLLQKSITDSAIDEKILTRGKAALMINDILSR